MKKTRLKYVTICIGILIVFVVISGIYCWYTHPTHYRYNDYYVIGNDVEHIQKRYGEFDCIRYSNEDGQVYYADYLVKDTDRWGNPPLYYAIEFRDGKAVSVTITGRVGG